MIDPSVLCTFHIMDRLTDYLQMEQKITFLKKRECNKVTRAADKGENAEDCRESPVPAYRGIYFPGFFRRAQARMHCEAWLGNGNRF